MRRSLGVSLIVLVMLASGACGAKKPPRVPSTPAPPPAPATPRLLTATPIADLALAWPPAIESLPLSSLLVEPPASRASRVASERDRAAETPPPVPPPPSPPDPPRLTTPGMPDDAAATRQVREQLDRARRSLGRLRYSRLTDAARAQYDTVLQLIQQAEDALKARNLVFAVKVADKAETLARRLAG